MLEFGRKRAALKNAMKTMLCGAFLLALSPRVLAAPNNVAAEKATETRAFSTVPAGDALYGNMAAIERAGWIQSSGTSSKRPLLTRYEIAVETAKAVFYTGARNQADAQWLSAAPRGSLRALRDLCKALKEELSGMGVNVRATLKMTDEALQPNFKVRAQDALLENRRDEDAAFESPSNEARISVSPLGAAMLRAANDPARVAQAQRLAASTRAFSGVESDMNWRLRLTPWMALRAGYGSRDLTTPLAVNDVPTSGAQRTDAVGGGIDLSLARNLSLSGRVENVEALSGANNPSWLRYSGQIGVTTFSNRLALSANLARLIPQDAAAAAATSAGVNLDLGINDRLKFKLLYQQLFGNTALPSGNVRVAGGVSLNF